MLIQLSIFSVHPLYIFVNAWGAIIFTITLSRYLPAGGKRGAAQYAAAAEPRAFRPVASSASPHGNRPLYAVVYASIVTISVTRGQT
jgi:hypothetical protein